MGLMLAFNTTRIIFIMDMYNTQKWLFDCHGFP